MTEPVLMTIPEVAELLGLSRNHAYALARQDALPVPVIKFSPKVWRVSKVMVDRLIETGSPVKAVSA